MDELTILCVVGARPNFVKISPLLRAIREHNAGIENKKVSPQLKKISPVIVHTEQHYDYIMSKIFFQDLDIPRPDIFLGVGSGSHAQQTGKTMIELEKIILKVKPSLVLVVGDVNSTLGAALASVKLKVPIAHVEAGLRSFDRHMPEEINRVLTDTVSDYLFTTSPEARDNLLKEGVDAKKIFFVGNVMVDSLLYYLEKTKKTRIISRYNLAKKKYAVLTLHRPGNVDNETNFKKIAQALKEIAGKIPLIFPAHPRTQKNIKMFGLEKIFNSAPEPVKLGKVHLIPPLGYMDFIGLIANSRLVLTDSGGLQEETTVLGVPCLTLRKNTERPITISSGTNNLVGNDPLKIVNETKKILEGNNRKVSLPEYWDGRSAQRIIEILSTNIKPVPESVFEEQLNRYLAEQKNSESPIKQNA